MIRSFSRPSGTKYLVLILIETKRKMHFGKKTNRNVFIMIMDKILDLLFRFLTCTNIAGESVHF